MSSSIAHVSIASCAEPGATHGATTSRPSAALTVSSGGERRIRARAQKDSLCLCLGTSNVHGRSGASAMAFATRAGFSTPAASAKLVTNARMSTRSFSARSAMTFGALRDARLSSRISTRRASPNLLRAKRALRLVPDAHAGLRGEATMRYRGGRRETGKAGRGARQSRGSDAGRTRSRARRRRSATARRLRQCGGGGGRRLTLMVRRCGASSPDTLCLARVFFDACFPWLCRLFRCPWPLGAGIAAGGVSHHATPAVKARTKSASRSFSSSGVFTKGSVSDCLPCRRGDGS